MSTNVDERTIAVQEHWSARGMRLINMALAIDLIVRVLVYKQGPRQYMDIFLIWIAAVFYSVIGMTASGVQPLQGQKIKLPVFLLIIAVSNTIMLALMGGLRNWVDLVATIVSTAVGASLTYFILRGIFSRWERRNIRNSTHVE